MRRPCEDNLSVPVGTELRKFIETEAEREERSLSAQVRYLLIQAMQARQANRTPAATSKNATA